jgi:hypothetical protein
MKKRWVILLVLVSIVCGVLFSFLLKNEKTNTVYINHVADSVYYQKQADSLATIVVGLKKVSESKGKEIVRLRALFAIKKDSVAILSPTETVNMFQRETGENTILQRDSSVITTLKAISISNVSFVEGRGLKEEIKCWEESNVIKDSLISVQHSLLTVKDTRIATLTNEYYKQQIATKNIEKANKKRMTKNVILGVSAGVLAGFVVGVIVR